MQKPDKPPEFLCMAPWSHTYLSPQSERRLCCASREPAQHFRQYIDTDNIAAHYNPQSLEQWWNSEHVRAVRRRMMAGEAPPECEVCNHKLLNNDVYRSHFWHLFKHRYDEIWETTDETGYTTMPVRSWDYRFSNLCNFKCRMCGDMLSSSWEAENRQRGVHNSPDRSWAQEPLRSHIQTWQEHATENEFGAAVEAGTVEEIYWVGGEPLMFRQHWQYMQRIVELGYADRVYVRYNTNLSRVQFGKNNLWDLLKHFQNWQICASLDGVEQRGEYIRTGLRYQSWLKNFEQAVQQRKSKNQLKLDFTLTTPGLLEIRNMVHLSQKYSVPLLAKVTFAFSPDVIMCPLILPKSLLHNIIEENLKWLESNADSDQRALVDVLTNLLDRPTFADAWPDSWQAGLHSAQKYINQIDSFRNGTTLADMLADDSRLLDWWNSI